MEKMVKVIALIEKEQKRRLYHILLDEDRSFAEWLRDQIDAYVKAKGKPRKGKEA